MANIGRLLSLADIIEKSLTFDMLNYNDNYGTPHCIAGHAKYLANKEGYIAEEHFQRTPKTIARSYLQLTREQAQLLFVPKTAEAHFMKSNPNSYGFISKERAAAVLRHFAKSGIIDWSIGIDQQALAEEGMHPTQLLPGDNGYEPS